MINKIGFKIGFVTYQATFNGNAASTRIRVTWPAKYMDNVYIGEDESILSKCKGAIFQTRFDIKDVDLAKRLKTKGIKILCDFTDPHWSHDYGGHISEGLKGIIEQADCVIFPTKTIEKSFNEVFEGKQTVVIPDRIDLTIYDKVKRHTDKDKYRIVWHGSFGNIGSIDLARSDLEKLGKDLGKDIDITLVCIYDHHKDHKIKEFNNIKLEACEWTNQKVIDELLNCEVSINPRYDNWKSYKSDNKTSSSWACGVPCIERDFYREIKRYLIGEDAIDKTNDNKVVGWISGADIRNAEGEQLRKAVERQYDVKISAKEIDEVVSSLLKGRAKTKKDITVYTSISGGFDGLREDQVIGDANYVAFVDTGVVSYVWDVRKIYKKFIDPNLEAKIFKVLPWQFIDSEYSIWMDGCEAIKWDAKVLIDRFLNGYDIAIFKHHARDDIYDEFIADMTYRQREPAYFRENQRQKYIDEGIPKKTGLFECGVIIRRHSEAIKRMCETWWAEITSYSSSDQCSFIYSMLKHGIKVNAITPGTQYDNPYFSRITHNKFAYDTYKELKEVKEIVEIEELNEIKGTQKVKLKRTSHETFHSPYTDRMNYSDIKEVPGPVAKRLIDDYPGAFIVIK